MSDDRDAPSDSPPNAERPYEIGYKRPPTHTRFGAGNRASKGRPPGSRNVRTIFSEAFSTIIRKDKEGREINRSRAEVALANLATKAANGDLKAIAHYLQYADRWAEPEPTASTPSEIDATFGRDILQSLFDLAKLTNGDKPSQADGGEDV